MDRHKTASYAGYLEMGSTRVEPQAAQAYSLCYAIYTYIETLYGNFWIGWFIRLCMEIHSISQKYMILLWMMK